MVHEKNEIYKKCERDIVEITQNVLQTKQKILPCDNFFNQGIYSIALVKIIIEIEKKYKFEIADDELFFVSFNKLEDIINYVIGKINHDDNA